MYVKYLDHAWFKNVNPALIKLITQEAWGVLDHEDEDQVTLIVARYKQPGLDGADEAKAIGLAIVKRTILELRRLD